MADLFVRCTCGSRLRLRAEHAGRVGRCACGRSVPVPPAAAFAQHAGRELTLAELKALLAKPQPPSAGPSPVPGLWRPGAVVDSRYEVKRKLGEGTFGAVWHVWDREHHQDLAVKELRPDKKASPQRRQNFLREARAWVVDLGMHPHVVRAWWVLELGGTPYLFLEYCGGGSLAQWIKDGRTRDLATSLDIAIQLCWGLSHCHAKQVVHRDLKPLNVLMTERGEAKLTDFGTVKFAALERLGDSQEPEVVSDLRRTVGGRLQGTPPYMPLEQWAEGGTLDRRADLYAFGVTLFELLTGAYPLRPASPTLAGWHQAHAQIVPTPVRSLRPDIPPKVEYLIQQCLVKQPQERRVGARYLAHELAKVYAQVTGRAYARALPQEAELLADSLNNIGLSLTVMGERAQADEAWQEALRVDPHHPEATYNDGLLQWRAAGMTDEQLLGNLREARTSCGDPARVDYLVGLVHLERNDCEAAIQTLDPEARTGAGKVEVRAARALAQERLHHSVRLLRTFGDGFSVAWSPDGWFALSSTSDDSLGLWEVASGRCLRTFEGHTDGVSSVAWSPDGRFALSGSEDNTLRLWEVSSGLCLRTFEGHTDIVTSVAFSPDGCFTLSGSLDKTVRLWEVSSGRCLRAFQGHSDGVWSVAWSPDGRLTLCGSSDETLRLWEVSSGRCLRAFQGHTSLVTSVAFSPDGRFALSASMDKTLRLWEVSSGRCVRSFEGHTDIVCSVTFSPDGRYALSGSGEDRTLRLWEVSSGRCLRTFAGHGFTVASVVWSPDGHFALSGGDVLQLWRVGSTWPALPLATSRPSPSGQTAYHRLLDQARQALALAEPLRALTLLEEARQEPGCARRADALGLARQLSRFLAHRAFSGGWERQTLTGITSAVNSAWSPDGRFVVSDSFDNTVRLWELSSGRCLRAFEGHTDSVDSVAFSPDGRFALSGSRDRTLRLWEVSSGRCLRAFQGHTDGVWSVAWCPDGRFVLSGSHDKTLRLWEVSSGRYLRSFKGHTSNVLSVAYNPDGRFALSGSDDRTLRLWEVSSGHCLRSFQGHTEAVLSVAYNPDGRFALSASTDKTLRLWEVSSGRCLRAFQGHTDGVWSVAWSPDGRFALSGSIDKTVGLWEITSGRCLRSFEGHAGSVTSVSWSPEGCLALSGSADNTLRLWELDWEFEPNQPADWDERAWPFLTAFLTLHTPYADGLERRGKPTWTEDDFRRLLDRLGCVGYGWLRPEGVRRELERMAAAWQGPPPLSGETP
jgi:WD40 repeat protein